MKYMIILLIFLYAFYPIISQEEFLYRAKTKDDSGILKVMSQPANDNLLFYLPYSQDLYVYAVRNDWVKIQTLRGSNGWIKKQFIEKYPEDYKFEHEIYYLRKAESLLPDKRSTIQIGIKAASGSFPKTNYYIPQNMYGGGLTFSYNFNRYASINVDLLYEMVDGQYY